jgi:pimeloyl-ACP methyl ester carboxylesterase
MSSSLPQLIRPPGRQSAVEQEPWEQRPFWVYLPGMDGSGRLLQPQLERLERFFEPRCLAIPEGDRQGWPGLASQVAAQLEALAIEAPGRPRYLCGESFGGCLALEIAAQAPQSFERLILVNPASSFARQALLGWGAPWVRWIGSWIYQLSAYAFLPLLIELPRVSGQDRQALVEDMRRLSPETVSWRLTMLSQFRLRPAALARLEQPVLIVVAECDRLLPSIAEGEYLARLFPLSTQVRLPYSGHACLLEAEVRLDDILAEAGFLPEPVSLQPLSCE